MGRVGPSVGDPVGGAGEELPELVGVRSGPGAGDQFDRHDLDKEARLDRAAVNLVPLLDHLDQRLPLAVEVLVRGGGKLGVDFRVGGHPGPEPVVGNQVVVAFLEGGDHVEGDHFAGQVVDVLDAEVDADGTPVGADPGGAVVRGQRLPYLLQDLAGGACRARRCPAGRS